MTFVQLKSACLELMAKLESLGVCSVDDEYQSVLDMIIEEMLNKQKRRAARKREFDTLQNTLTNLDEKMSFLNDQKKSYHDYIDACMMQLQSKNKR